MRPRAASLCEPFFGTLTGTQASGSRRLLVVSYHFPPSAEVGGLRWQAFARFAVDNGWAVDVITRDPAKLERRDDRRLDELPSSVRVFAVPEHNPLVALPLTAWQALRRHFPRSTHTWNSSGPTQVKARLGVRAVLARGYFAWLDFAKGEVFARAAADLGIALSRKSNYSLIASSGPPHMVHEGARRIAVATGTPLALDFRDPWSLVERIPEHIASPIWFRLATRHEQRVVRDASLIIMNTDLSCEAMAARYPHAKERIVAIRNGSDDEPLPSLPRPATFSIRFAGSIYIDRDPRLVLRASARVIHGLQLRPGDFRLCFMGEVESFGGESLRAIAEQEGIGDYIDILPPGPRSEALRFLSAGTMLLNLPQDSHLAIPAKIFEYVRFPAWLLVLAAPNSSTARLLQGSGADVVEPHDVEGMENAIRTRFIQFQNGERPLPVGAAEKYSRKHQASLLFRRLEALLPAAPSRPSEP